MTNSARAQSRLVRDLKGTVAGRVIAPSDPGYDEVRRVFPGDVDRRSTVFVRAANGEDVAHVVTIAGATGTELSVRSGAMPSALVTPAS